MTKSQMPVEDRLTATRLLSRNMTFINMSAVKINMSSPHGMLPSCDSSTVDVTHMIIVVCIGVVMPTVIVSVIACVLTVCRQCRHQFYATAVALPSETLPRETVNNRLHNKKRFMDEGRCDVTAPIHSCANPVTLTVVNIISDSFAGGRMGEPRNGCVNYSRIRSDVAVFGGSNPRDNNSVVNSIAGEALSSESMLEIVDGDRNFERSFKNSRIAAKNNMSNVTVGFVNEYYDVTDLQLSWRREEHRRGAKVCGNSSTTDCLLRPVVVDDWSAKSRVSGSTSEKTS